MENIINILKRKAAFRSLRPAVAEDIQKAEQTLNLKFAKDYKEYVQAFGAVTYEGHELTGICSSERLNVIMVSEEEKTYNPNVPSDWYVIEQTNMDGAVVWQRADGTVYQTFPGEKPEQIAESLADYVLNS